MQLAGTGAVRALQRNFLPGASMKTPLRRLWPAIARPPRRRLHRTRARRRRNPRRRRAGRQAAAPAVAPAGQPAIAGALPNFAALVEAYGPAVVNVSTVAGAREVRGARPEISPDDPLYDFFRGFGFGEPRRPAAAGARRGLGLRRQRRRLHPDQRARGRRCARGHGAHDGPPRVSRQGRRHRRAHRRRGAQDRREGPAGGAHGRPAGASRPANG